MASREFGGFSNSTFLAAAVGYEDPGQRVVDRNKKAPERICIRKRLTQAIQLTQTRFHAARPPAGLPHLTGRTTTAAPEVQT